MNLDEKHELSKGDYYSLLGENKRQWNAIGDIYNKLVVIHKIIGGVFIITILIILMITLL